MIVSNIGVFKLGGSCSNVTDGGACLGTSFKISSSSSQYVSLVWIWSTYGFDKSKVTER